MAKSRAVVVVVKARPGDLPVRVSSWWAGCRHWCDKRSHDAYQMPLAAAAIPPPFAKFASFYRRAWKCAAPPFAMVLPAPIWKPALQRAPFQTPLAYVRFASVLLSVSPFEPTNTLLRWHNLTVL